MKLIVTQDFDYRHPSGMAVTALKADPEPITTKREIAEYAVRMGFGTAVDGDVKPSGGSLPKRNYIIDTGPTEGFTPATDAKIVTK